MQHLQPADGVGTLSRKARRRQARRDLDDTGVVSLVCLRRTRVGAVFQLNARSRRRAHRGDVRLKQVSNGPNVVGLGLRLVPNGPTSLTLRYASQPERESRTLDSTRLGTNV